MGRKKRKILVDNCDDVVGTRFIVIDEFGVKPNRTLDSKSIDYAKHTVAKHPSIFGTSVRICSLKGETLAIKETEGDWR